MTVLIENHNNQVTITGENTQFTTPPITTKLTQCFPRSFQKSSHYTFFNPNLLAEKLTPKGTKPLSIEEFSIISAICQVLSLQSQPQTPLNPAEKRDLFLAALFETAVTDNLNEDALASILNRMISQKIIYFACAQNLTKLYSSFKDFGPQVLSQLPTFQQSPLSHNLDAILDLPTEENLILKQIKEIEGFALRSTLKLTPRQLEVIKKRGIEAAKELQKWSLPSTLMLNGKVVPLGSPPSSFEEYCSKFPLLTVIQIQEKLTALKQKIPANYNSMRRISDLMKQIKELTTPSTPKQLEYLNHEYEKILQKEQRPVNQTTSLSQFQQNFSQENTIAKLHKIFLKEMFGESDVSNCFSYPKDQAITKHPFQKKSLYS
jgi:hypothetical protein